MQKIAIHTILFDLGGVILDLNIKETIKAFDFLGWEMDHPENITSGNHSVFSNLEVGNDSPQQFRDKLRQFFPNFINDQQLDHAWNAMLIGFSVDTINYIKELKEKYQLFLLSNTNEIHLNWFRSMFKQKFGHSFDDLFVRTFYSHEMGLKKPDHAIFKKVIEQSEICPDETLFIDDSKANTITADQLGFQTLHIQPGSLLKTLPGFLKQEKEMFI